MRQAFFLEHEGMDIMSWNSKHDGFGRVEELLEEIARRIELPDEAATEAGGGGGGGGESARRSAAGNVGAWRPQQHTSAAVADGGDLVLGAGASKGGR